MAQIQFKGKSLVWNHHLGVEYHELVPDKSKSLTDSVSLKDNLIIHGDNLKALKALLPTYAGKVKCIYIDPPYNTGNEGWKYSDSVSSPMIKEWLGKVVDKDDLTRHDKWLCMMTPRLKLLRELMSDDGVIFISIDDNEQHHLRQLMDEIFGEENFVATIARKRRASQANLSKDISPIHEYLMVHRKSDAASLNRIAANLDETSYKNPDDDPRGPYVTMPISNKGGSRYEVRTPTGVKHEDEWRFKEETYNKLLSDGRIVFPRAGSGKPRYKLFLSEKNDEGVLANTWWDDAGSNQEGARELIKIFGELVFDNPKPVALVKKILALVTDKNSIILDSFAGTGTTANAVSDLNKEDGGDRKFILVEMEDYADNLTAERVRRVIKKGLPSSFSYFDLGDAIDEVGILSGKSLPSYGQMARYLFYTATGEEFDEGKVDEAKNFIGASKDYEVYLFYKPDIDYLKNTALNLDKAKGLPAFSGKRRLVFAPAKYLDQDTLNEYHIDFAQLPFEIYKKQK